MEKDIKPIPPNPRGGYRIVSMNRPDAFDAKGKLVFPNAGLFCIVCQSFDHVVTNDTKKPAGSSELQYPSHCTRCGSTTDFYPADPSIPAQPFKPNYTKDNSKDSKMPYHQIIVCANEHQYRRAKRQAEGDPYTVVSKGERASELMGRAFYRVIVCEGVDLNKVIQGEGPLGSILKSRQRTFTRPIWIEL